MSAKLYAYMPFFAAYQVKQGRFKDAEQIHKEAPGYIDSNLPLQEGEGYIRAVRIVDLKNCLERHRRESMKKSSKDYVDGVIVEFEVPNAVLDKAIKGFSFYRRYTDERNTPAVEEYAFKGEDLEGCYHGHFVYDDGAMTHRKIVEFFRQQAEESARNSGQQEPGNQ